MEFTFTEDQLMFRDSARGMLENECSADRVRASWETESGRSAELWGKLAELGLLGLLVPEEHGGLDLSEVDAILPFEESGRAALPEPLVETAAVAAPLLRELGGSLATEWLPRVAAGAARVAIGHPIDRLVLDAHVADLLLLADGDALHALSPDRVQLERQPCNDPSRRLFRVTWSPQPATRVASGEAAHALVADALERGALATAAQLVGVGQKMVDIAVAYAKQREQFGAQIGSFQAIKHMLATVQVKLEFARPLVYRAAHSVARAESCRAADVSQAKSVAGEAAVAAAKTALQVHGAIGYTWECDLQIWMKRAWALDLAWGSGAWHRARLGSALFDGTGPVRSFGYRPRPGQ
jgi:alkylation response protein AidB-like acyl-CoA dehydrogenase